jgi:S-methylmethionine-dependent homocysteine/selenocysteine methylase
MAGAVSEARAALGDADLQLGVYANAFPPQPKHAAANDGLDPIRQDLPPQTYLHFAEQWTKWGANIIGGCCGVGPEHIAALAQARDALANAIK